MQEVEGSNPFNRLPRLMRPGGFGLRGVSSFRASFSSVRALVVLGLVVLAAAGCGGGSGGTPLRIQGQARAQPQSKASFIEVADVVCKNNQSPRGATWNQPTRT